MAEMVKSSYWDMDESLSSYLAEIAHSQPLSTSEEVNLARQIKEGGRFIPQSLG